MKIHCHCGAIVSDNADSLPYKAHFIPDQDWLSLLDAVDDAIENSGPSAKEKETACMKVRQVIGASSRSAWQCRVCGRVYIHDQGYVLRQLVPGKNDLPRELFRSRPSAEEPAESVPPRDGGGVQ